jgi:hypothetical protein
MRTMDEIKARQLAALKRDLAAVWERRPLFFMEAEEPPAIR